MKTKVTNQHNYTLGELKQPEDFDRSKTYLKVIHESKIHYDMEYKLGINEDVLPFNDNPNKSCVEGGLYFTTLEYLPYFCDYGTLVAEIKILDNSKLIKESNTKYRTDKFEILKFWDINDFLEHVGYIHINGTAKFSHLKTAKGLESLKSIEYSAYFNNLESAKGLENLEKVDGTVFFNSLKTAESIKNLKTIGGYAYFDSLKTAKGLESLESIGGSALFRNLKSEEGLENLKSINGYVHFRNLESSK
jgi:hypothetical protein